MANCKNASLFQEVVMELLAEKMLAEINSSKGFLIDGYPREVGQGRQFEKDVSK